MKLSEIRNLDSIRVNKIRAEIEKIPGFPFQVAHINLTDEHDPSAIENKSDESLTIVSDLHSYSKEDRIFPVNQDENSVFAQHVYQDSLKNAYNRVLDIGTGSGIIAMTLAKANTEEVIATDINPRAEEFINKNNEINGLSVRFVKSDLFNNVKDKFDKITIDPPFMPAPKGTFPLHAWGGILGTENVIEPFFKGCWNFINGGGCIQGIFQSFANDSSDTILNLLLKYLPDGWSFEIKHVFPVKNVPIELYTSSLVGHDDYTDWIKEIENKNFKYVRFFMLSIRNTGKDGLQKEEFSKPRLYNIIYSPTTMKYLSEYSLRTKLLQNPVSENDYPLIGHLIRLSRYNYSIYLILYNLFS